MVLDVLKYAGIVLVCIVGYELVRRLVVGAVAKRLRQSTKQFVRDHDVRLDRYKLMNKAFVEAELLNDPELNRKIVAHAQAEGRPVLEVRREVEVWIDEIVPFFNLASYFKLGQGVARLALGAVYDVVIDRAAIERVHERLPKDAVLVYVMNHRSNADYVLVAYMLRHQIALSYAVGEWARVWPLEGLFKSFGSYFIRRRFRNELYHAVLEKYVQLISRRGVTQGFFPEGGLTRDGLLRDPKIGLLAYIVGIKADPSVQEEVYFVPVGINYDWVLEDRALLEELAGKRKGPLRFAGKVLSLLLLLGRLPVTLFINLGRLALRRLKRHGYASASFGAPMPLSPWLEKYPELCSSDREVRRPRLKQLADELMRAVGDVIPVTPVPLVSRVLLDLGAKEVSYEALLRAVRDRREELRARGARFALGHEFSGARAGRERIRSERESRRPELVEVEEEIIGWDEAKATCRFAVAVLRTRRLAKVRGGMVRLRPGAEPILRYYANSIEQLIPGAEAASSRPGGFPAAGAIE